MLGSLLQRMLMFCEEVDGGGASGGGGATGTGGDQGATGGDAGAGGGGGGTTTPPAPSNNRNSKVVPMARESIAKLAREHQDKGKKAAQAELDKKAKKLGYGSADEMFASIEQNNRRRQGAQGNRRDRNDRSRGGGNGERRNDRNGDQNARGGGNGGGDRSREGQRPQNNDRNRNRDRDDRRDRENQERIDRERRARLKAQRDADEARREAYAAEATGELKVMALQLGIRDPDYAIALMTRELESERGKLQSKFAGADLEREFGKVVDAFDETKYFEGLKKTRPYLFQETVVDANTGTTRTGEGGPPPPGAGQVTQVQVNNRQKNARDMSSAEYRAEIRRRGLKVPTM